VGTDSGGKRHFFDILARDLLRIVAAMLTSGSAGLSRPENKAVRIADFRGFRLSTSLGGP
jgi:hypothetical protein